jgi:hypothetical protein
MVKIIDTGSSEELRGESKCCAKLDAACQIT